MNIKNLVENINELHGQRIEISGYMHVTKPFSYMYVNEELTIDNEYVLILDSKIVTCLETATISGLVGTPVLYAGWTTLVCSVYKNWGFPMFSAVIRSVSEMSFEYFSYNNDDKEEKHVLHEMFFEPKKNLYLRGGKSLNNKQVQTIKHIVKGSDNFISVKNKFSQQGNHLLAFHLDALTLNQLQQQLEVVNITDYYWGYSEND